MAYRAPMVFNNSTGSDSAASGIGPATAVTGSGAYCAGSTTTIDLSMDTPDLSGVQVGDCIYIPTLSGTERCFLQIASVTPITYIVTVSTTITNTFSTASWAIGGKRALGDTAAGRSPFDSANMASLFDLEYEIEYTGTDYSHSTGITITENCSIVGTGSQMPKLVMTTNSQAMFSSVTTMATNTTGIIANLWITNNGTATSTIAIDWNDESLIVTGCKIGHDTATPVDLGIIMSGTKAGLICVNNEFHTSSTSVIGSTGSTSMLTVTGCSFNGDASGINFNNSSGIANIIGNSFTGGTYGVNMNQSDRFCVANNAFNNISNTAIYTNSGETGCHLSNAINDCGTGINASAASVFNNRVYGNYFNNNTTDVTTDWDTYNNYNSSYDTALGGDPFTSATDTTLAGNAASDILLDTTAADALSFEGSEVRPFGHLNVPSGGGGGGSVIVIEE